ncbi:MAG: 3-dehydroquinate synthase [Pseudomonadota bacterium]
MSTVETAPSNEERRCVSIPLPGRAYDVLIGDDLLEDAGTLIAARCGRRRAMVVSDEIVAPLHLKTLDGALKAAGIETQTHIVPAGEGAKSWALLTKLTDDILAAKLERRDVVIALGGGVVGDLAGFAAAIARRGMPFVQVPTTLLAQVDSAVGGKTGINNAEGKNLIGAFHQPALVISDMGTLKTLPDRQRRSGYAEIAKAALINDPAAFDRLERLGARALTDDLSTTIGTAVRTKAEIVLKDELEAGERALLNLGHTFAHAIEQCAGYDGRIAHGEAVGLGICLAFRLSTNLGICPRPDAERAAAHIAAVGLPTTFAQLPLRPSQPEIQSAMTQDKKVMDGVVRFVLVRGIGKAFVSQGVEPQIISKFLQEEGLASS